MEELKEKVCGKLNEVMDNELPISIYELGLIYGINLEKKDNGICVSIDMTLIDSRCSSTTSLIDEINTKVESLDEIEKSEVHMVYSPKWDMTKIKPEGLEKLRAASKTND